MADATLPLSCPPGDRRSSPRSDAPGNPVESHFAYGRPFWLAYTANLLMVIGVALLFRYADFVTFLGGTEFHLGWIVGVGMVGSLVMRLAMGSCIDHYGTKVVWVGSALLLAVSCFAHLAVTSYRDVAIYVLRILFCVGHAGIAGASMTFVSKRGSTRQIAEMIGMLGTSGFLGIVLGSLLGDIMLGSVTVDRHQIERMFIVAGTLCALSCPFAWLATRTEVLAGSSRRLSLLGALRRHHPGSLLVVSIAMGLGLGLPGIFLRTYAAELNIPRIGAFFMTYAATAIVTRMLTRRWPERYGNRPIILLGTAAFIASMLLFLPVHSEFLLIVPAISFGFSHAVLFPAVMAAGNMSFPSRHRGLATVLILAASDVGTLLGAPAAGAVLKYARPVGLPPYPTMFVTMAGLMAMVGLGYFLTSRPAKR